MWGVGNRRLGWLVILCSFFCCCCCYFCRKNLVKFISLVASTVHGKNPEAQGRMGLRRETIWNWRGTFVVCPPQPHGSCEVSLLHTVTILECEDEENGPGGRPEAFTPHPRLIRNPGCSALRWGGAPGAGAGRSNELMVVSCCLCVALLLLWALAECWLPSLCRVCFPHRE